MNSKKKKTKRKKIRKSYISTVAALMATATIIFCIHYLVFEARVFDLNGFKIEGLTMYSSEYIIEKANVVEGQKLYAIDLDEIEKTVEEEAYVKSCKASYYLPNKLNLDIVERKEKFSLTYGDEVIILDKDGYVLDGNYQDVELFPIESYSEVKYSLGEQIEIEGLRDFEKIYNLLEYTQSLEEKDKVSKLYIHEDNIVSVDTFYGMIIKFELDQEEKYSYDFGMTVLKERLILGEVVEGCLLDFTKGDRPIFSFGASNKGD